MTRCIVRRREGFSIRRWMVAAMFTCLLFPGAAFGIALLVESQLIRNGEGAQQRAVADTLLRDAATDTANWRDPQWQRAFRDRLVAAKSSLLIQDDAGNDIFRVSANPREPRTSWGQAGAQRAVVVESGRRVGVVTLYSSDSLSIAARIAMPIGFALAFGCVFWQLRRFVVRPLEALGRAARRVAQGDLSFTLPFSPVREVAAVCEAFNAMGAGLRQSIAQQAALEEERRFFVSAIAHDLRTPLFALRGYLIGLEQGVAVSPEKTAQYIALARQRADHLDHLVSDLFTYTQVEYLEGTLHRERIAFGPLAVQRVDDLIPRAVEKGVTVTVNAPDQPDEIAADSHLLQRALENLLDNALRYTPQGGEIVMRWLVAAGRVQFTVEDTGPGIAPRDLPHLFEPLYRGETSRNRDTGGAGLGLTIARRILRAHGGDLTAANRAEGGAAFTGWLPLLPPEHETDLAPASAITSPLTRR